MPPMPSNPGSKTEFAVVNGQLYHRHDGYSGWHPAKQKHRNGLHERLGLDEQGKDKEGQADKVLLDNNVKQTSGTSTNNTTFEEENNPSKRTTVRQRINDDKERNGGQRYREGRDSRIGGKIGTSLTGSGRVVFGGLEGYKWQSPTAMSQYVRQTLFHSRPSNPWGASLFDCIGAFSSVYEMAVGLDKAFGVSKYIGDKFNDWLETRQGKSFQDITIAREDGASEAVTEIKNSMGDSLKNIKAVKDEVEKDKQIYVYKKQYEAQMNGKPFTDVDKTAAEKEFEDNLDYTDYIEYADFETSKALYNDVYKKAIQTKEEMEKLPEKSPERMKAKTKFLMYRDFLVNMNNMVQRTGEKKIQDDEQEARKEQAKREMRERMEQPSERKPLTGDARRQARANRNFTSGNFRQRKKE